MEASEWEITGGTKDRQPFGNLRAYGNFGKKDSQRRKDDGSRFTDERVRRWW